MAAKAVAYPTDVAQALKRLSDLEHEVQELRAFLLAHTPCSKLTATSLDHALGQLDVPSSTSASSGHWEVTCLGGFHLSCGGRTPPLCSSRRGQSILKYLLARKGYAATPDALIECFWPEADPSAGTHNLQMAVYALRRSLCGCGPHGSDETVLFRKDNYLLNPALSIVQDVDSFRGAYERGKRAAVSGQVAEAQRAFEEARACYAGDYLADSPYEEWAASYRTALQDMQLTVLSHLATCYSQAAEWESAITCCSDILVADPYREDAYRQLMRCYAACGRVADVQRTYHACQTHLHHDLHLAPAPKTVALYQHLVAQTPRERVLSDH